MKFPSIRRLIARATTHDREAADVHVTQPLGRTQALTPEGFLLCKDVAIARLGTMVYGPGEVPITPGKDGVSYVTRDADVLFAEDTINSYHGKAVVNDHPVEDVTPANWKKYAIGTVLNPRRGTGDSSDLLLADLLITDAAAIREIQAGKRDVSAGYDASYEQTGEGAGRQVDIIGNHVALVTRGRCGPRCSIGDSDPNPSTLKGTRTMATKNARARVRLTPEAIRTAFKDAGDNLAEQLSGEAEAGADEDDTGDGATHIHIHAGGSGATPPGDDAGAPAADDTGGDDGAAGGDPIEARFQALEAGHQQILQKIDELAQAIGGGATPPMASKDDADEVPDALSDVVDGQGDTKQSEAKTTDSAALATAFQKMVADAEVLVPGCKVPTFDAATSRAKTIDTACQFRRRVLAHTNMTRDGATLLASVNEGGQAPDVDGLTCPQVATLFNAAATTKRAINNRAATGDGRMGQPIAASSTKVLTPAELNRQNAEFWKNR